MGTGCLRFVWWCVDMIGLFSVSDIVIAVTLVMNAIAVLKYKVKVAPKADVLFGEKEDPSILEKVGNVVSAVRTLRGLVAVWNVFVLFLMFVFFSS